MLTPPLFLVANAQDGQMVCASTTSVALANCDDEEQTLHSAARALRILPLGDQLLRLGNQLAAAADSIDQGSPERAPLPNFI
ncbi:MAG TPA: hypothetical protein DEA80_16560 [Afipia sp.]|jgi:hypothetical protein|nr:hypothetical protein [Afipia sp.]OUX63034.1 MAG: hypothetical protein CBB64_01080 [Afipia sp. TMED4]HAO39699.1 hypothetical protein [Afipia sp.]HAP09756.1 hypothetical protein [Afipia sp.]HAP47265.1 hypothetical protein [Afipia sp.]|tara:strand:- start:288 stop:533 length:246 start_codon:yes stop_codon:yes gene_type:complete